MTYDNMMKKKFANKKEAMHLISKLGDEFVVVKNPGYIHPVYELYPLAPKIKKPVSNLTASVMDMDGTTTTTEALCIHSLEYMVRKLSGRMTKQQWKGLDPAKDYPHIIGNSTTKHVEYLIAKYQKTFKNDQIIKSYLYAAGWTIIYGKDVKRKEEVLQNSNDFNCIELIKDERLLKLNPSSLTDDEDEMQISDHLFTKYNSQFKKPDFNSLVRIGIDAYYQRYHEILERIKLGEGKFIAEKLFGNPDKHLIEAMPGIEIILPMIKGLITSNEGIYFDQLLIDYEIKSGKKFPYKNIDKARSAFNHLCKHFAEYPLKVAVVTSSIYYEADIVLREVFKIILSKLDRMLPNGRDKINILSKFNDYRNYYDAVITASDSNEIRLKPHRDLYSIALYKLNVPREKFDQVVGFEDSESGTIAIRAAGIGLSIAVPFAETSGHNLKAATYICKSGLPEVILKYNLFLNHK
jgi:beta-phosphoglucomutase-like phosphatase (HAD superfamily)